MMGYIKGRNQILIIYNHRIFIRMDSGPPTQVNFKMMMKWIWLNKQSNNNIGALEYWNKTPHQPQPLLHKMD